MSDAFGDGRPPGDVPGFLPARLPGQAGPAHGWTYSAALGELIAELYVDDSSAGGLWALHAAMPDRIPPPRIVAVWKRQFPAFGLLMASADKVRAERLMEETVYIADTDPAAAPKVALRIAARQRLAESLDATRYGSRANAAGTSAAPGLAHDQPTAPELTDAALLAIAASALDAAPAGREGGAPRGENA